MTILIGTNNVCFNGEISKMHLDYQDINILSGPLVLQNYLKIKAIIPLVKDVILIKYIIRA